MTDRPDERRVPGVPGDPDERFGYVCARCGLPLRRNRVTGALRGPNGRTVCPGGTPHARRYYAGR